MEQSASADYLFWPGILSGEKAQLAAVSYLFEVYEEKSAGLIPKKLIVKR